MFNLSERVQCLIVEDHTLLRVTIETNFLAFLQMISILRKNISQGIME